MPLFELTARSQIHRSNGLHISRGETITINIPMSGITPVNLFGNSRCTNQLVQQFKNHGIEAPISDSGVFSRGAWDIKMK